MAENNIQFHAFKKNIQFHQLIGGVLIQFHEFFLKSQMGIYIFLKPAFIQIKEVVYRIGEVESEVVC